MAIILPILMPVLHRKGDPQVSRNIFRQFPTDAARCGVPYLQGIRRRSSFVLAFPVSGTESENRRFPLFRKPVVGGGFQKQQGCAGRPRDMLKTRETQQRQQIRVISETGRRNDFQINSRASSSGDSDKVPELMNSKQFHRSRLQQPGQPISRSVNTRESPRSKGFYPRSFEMEGNRL